MFLVVEPEDTLEVIEAELAFILSEDGFGLILFVPKDSKIDPRLTAALA